MASITHPGLFLKQRTGVTLRSNLAISTVGVNIGANSFRAHPFMVTQRLNLDRIGFEITGVGGAGAGCYVGLYTDNGNFYPATLIVDGGTFDCSAVGGVGIKLANVNVVLEPGLYWLAFLCNDAAITFTGPENSRQLRMKDSDNSMVWSVAQAYGALPNPYPGGAGNDNGPIPYYRIASYS